MSAPQMTVAIDDGGRHATAYVPSQAATLDLRGDTEHELMTAVFAQAHAEARSSGQTITVAVSGGADTAPMRLEVDPDQTIRAAPEQTPAPTTETTTRRVPRRPAAATPVVQAWTDGERLGDAEVSSELTDHPGAPEGGWDLTPPARPRRSTLAAPEIAPGAGEPARHGLRGRLNALLGLNLAPKAQSPETRLRATQARITRDLPDFSVLTVANPKGGVGKTPFVVALSQTLADLRGAGTVVCADLGEVGGSLARRVAIPPPTGRDIHGLLAAHPNAGAAIRPSVLTRHLTRQPCGEDIIAGRRSGTGSILNTEDAAQLAAIVAQHRDILVADTGNNPVAGSWQWAVTEAAAVVVPVPLRPDSADAAQEMLENLAAADGVLQRTIVVITNGPGDTPMVEQVAVDAFTEWGVPVLRMPFEPRFASGERIALPQLQGNTRTALTTLAAYVVEMIGHPTG